MPGEQRLGALAAVLLAAGVLAGTAGPARAQVYGTAQFQYQNSEEVRDFLLPDGTRVVRRATTEQLVKSVDMRHQSYLRPNLMLDSNLRFSELTRPGSQDRSRTPTGTLRLLHPAFQLTAQHQPSTQRSTTSGAQSVGAIDTSRSVSTTKSAETMLLGNARVPGGVQLNASWVDRRREATETSPLERTRVRNARASYDRDRWSLYGTLGDQQQRSGASGVVRARQRQYGAGGLWRYVPGRTASMTFQYDLGSARSEPGGGFTSTSTTQNASVSGEWRPRGTFSTSSSYNWRRAGTRNVRSVSQTDQEGALFGRWQPVRTAYVSAGGGFRTQRLVDGGTELLEYAGLVAAFDGRVRQGWTMNGSASHTTTWDPERGSYGVQSLSGLSRMALSSRISLEATTSITANGDTAAASQRWANAWSARLNAQPLRTLAVVLGVRGQRIGPGLLRPASVSRGGSADVTWRPHPRLDTIGNYSITEALTTPHQRARTWASTTRLQLSETWQFQGSWTRTAQPRTEQGVETVVTREQGLGRLLWQPTRRLAVSGAYGIADPWTELESTRVDATLTWSFGR